MQQKNYKYTNKKKLGNLFQYKQQILKLKKKVLNLIENDQYEKNKSNKIQNNTMKKQNLKATCRNNRNDLIKRKSSNKSTPVKRRSSIEQKSNEKAQTRKVLNFQKKLSFNKQLPKKTPKSLRSCVSSHQNTKHISNKYISTNQNLKIQLQSLPQTQETLLTPVKQSKKKQNKIISQPAVYKKLFQTPKSLNKQLQKLQISKNQSNSNQKVYLNSNSFNFFDSFVFELYRKNQDLKNKLKQQEQRRIRAQVQIMKIKFNQKNSINPNTLLNSKKKALKDQQNMILIEDQQNLLSSSRKYNEMNDTLVFYDYLTKSNITNSLHNSRKSNNQQKKYCEDISINKKSHYYYPNHNKSSLCYSNYSANQIQSSPYQQLKKCDSRILQEKQNLQESSLEIKKICSETKRFIEQRVQPLAKKIFQQNKKTNQQFTLWINS